MTEQEIHTSLKLLKSKRKVILELKEQIAFERVNLDGIATVSWTSTKVSGGVAISPQERYLERTERLKKRLYKVLDEYGDLECKMLNLIDALSPFSWLIILNRFFIGMSMKKTAQAIGYSIDYVHQRQAAAIKEMSEHSNKPHPD